jgi:hypothetical protein
LGGKGMWGRGPALYKQNYLKKKKKKSFYAGYHLCDYFYFQLL